VLHRPEQSTKAHGIGTQERLEIDALNTEAEALPVQRASIQGIERLDLGTDLGCRQDAERADQLKDEPARVTAE